MDITMESAPADKIRLFRAMFRGREDVYARRYVSAKSGKSGYSPVCAIEWTHGLCDKRKGKRGKKVERQGVIISCDGP